MKTAELNVEPRKSGIKSELNKLRREGYVPANIYGPGLKNSVFRVDERLLRKAYGGPASSNLLLTLKSSDPELNGKRAILKEVDRDPVGWRPRHLDFLEVAGDRALTVNVPLEFKGTPKGVKLSSGILQIIRRSLEISALPDHIPGSIEVDISDMDVNETLHVSDLTLPENVVLNDEPTYSVVSVTEQAEEEAPSVVAPAAGETPEGEAAPAAEGAAATEGAAAAAPAKPDEAKKSKE